MKISKHVNFRGLLLAATILPAAIVLWAPAPAFAQLGVVVSVRVAPPMLPVYAQPPMPEEGYIWTPGYWQWAARSGYYWIPGTWILPPSVGALWTPPYWGWDSGVYVFHAGYWGPHVGYYGGVNYGHGYSGVGYQGGRWDGGHFAYNRSINNFGRVHVADAYRENVTVINRSHVSYTGGRVGIKGEPREQEREAEHETHLPVTSEQTNHNTAAAGHPGLVASHNNARPEIAATSRPAQFNGAGVVRPQATRAATDQHAAPPAPQTRAAVPPQEAAHQGAPHQEPAHEERGRER